MKGWMNKPPAVAALVILAVVTVYFNVYKPMMGSSRDEVPSLGLMQGQELPFATGVLTTALTTADQQPVEQQPISTSSHTDWLTLEQRTHNTTGRTDPFRPFSPAALSPVTAKTSTVSTDVAVRSNPHPEVQAIVIGPASSYAMINHQIVSEGDSVNGYKIMKITKNIVTVHGHAGTLTLTYDPSGGQ